MDGAAPGVAINMEKVVRDLILEGRELRIDKPKFHKFEISIKYLMVDEAVKKMQV